MLGHVPKKGMAGLLSGVTGFTVIAAACGVGPNTTSPRHAAAPRIARSAPSAVEHLTVVPSSGLQDGQQVTVTVKGFPPSRRFFLSECSASVEANDVGCGQQLAAQPVGLTDGNGSGSTSFSVQASASADHSS